MKITNKFGLPEPLASALGNDKYKQVGDISVTGLIKPPKVRVLEKRHWNDLEEDISERVYRFLGSSVHEVFSRGNTDNALSEERLSVEIEGWKVSGQLDFYHADGTLSDYKVTSVYSFMLGDKIEWEQQLNCYAYLLNHAGFPVKSLRIVAILRDWQASKVAEGYPPAPAISVPVELWDLQNTEDFICSRVQDHKNAEKLSDDEIKICSPKERWERPTTWALKKKKNIRATKVFDSEETAKEALEWMPDKKDMEIVKRPGESVRCLRYCSVSKFCNFGKTLEGNSNDI